MELKQRSHNKRQELFCDRCARVTAHTANDTTQPSGWIKLKEGIRAYRQYRECMKCGGATGELGEPIGFQWTVEVTEGDVNRVCEELNELRQFRDSIKAALDLVKS